MAPRIFDKKVGFSQEQVAFLEDLIVNALSVTWIPKRGKDCSDCIRAAERVIDEVRKLRDE